MWRRRPGRPAPARECRSSPPGYFATDSLGHVFANVYPGNVPGVLVIVPQGSGQPLVFGPVPGATVAGAAGSPFTLSVSSDNCSPTCAGGTTSYHTLETLGLTVVDHDPR